MKKRCSLLLALVLCGGLSSRSLASRFETLSPDFKIKELNQTINNPLESEAMKEIAKGVKKDLERSIPLTPEDADGNPLTDIKWTLNTFLQGSTPTMYLAMETAVGTDLAKTYALAQATVSSGKVVIQPLANKAIVNGGAAADSPFMGAAIGTLSTMNGLPVVVVNDAVKGLNVYLVAGPNPVTATILQNATGTIKDATPDVIDNQIVSVAASESYIFAVVPANGYFFNNFAGEKRGIAVLKKSDTSLTVLNASNLSDTTTPKAALIDVTAAKKLIAFNSGVGITSAVIGSDAVYSTYDKKMGRMYICLTEITGDVNAEGGVLGIFTARVDKATDGTLSLKVEPFVVDPNPLLFVANSPDYIIGYNADTDATSIGVSTKFPRVMHTSTGRDYLIIQSTVTPTVGDPVVGVYALPLLPNDASIAIPAAKGTLAAVDGTTGVAADFLHSPNTPGDMVEKSLPAVVIPFTTTNWSYLTDIFVEGDSVFFCVNDTVGDTSGVYRCTPIIDGNGFIINWTEPRRVTGDLRHVWGGAIDNRTGNIYCITAQDETTNKDKNNTVRVTQWGKSDTVAMNGDSPTEVNNLSSVLAGIFSEDTGNIHQIVSFDDATPGFASGQFAMMVALGFDNIAMIQTAKIAAPIEKFDATPAALTQNVFGFSGNPVLQNIGPLCCCELSRIAEDAKGWLMVGGYKGAAVLRTDAGAGFDNDLANLDGTYPGDGATFYFSKLVVTTDGTTLDADFANIRKIVAAQGYFFIFTQYYIYMLEATADNFSDENIRKLTLGTNIWKVKMTNDAVINDAIGWSATNPRFLLATTKGLFKATINLTSHAFVSEPTEIKMQELDSAGDPVDVTPSLPVVHLSYISKTRGNPSILGNLFVLCAQVKKDIAKIYRFYVNGTNYEQVNQYDPTEYIAGEATGIIPTPFITFTTYRGNIISDGAILYHLCAKHLDRTDYFNAIPQGYVGNEYDLWGSFMSSVDTDTYRMVGALIQEGAFGGWMFPTDSGLWVNL